MSGLFALPWALPLAPLLAVAAALLVLRAAHYRSRRMERMAESSTLDRIAPARRSPRWRATVLALAAALAAVAFAGPQWGTERTIVRSEGADIVLALDASLSMLAEDVEPNRLTRMKREATQLIASSAGDRFGIIAFAGRSYILTPMTVDRGALGLFLDNLDPNVVGQGGSSLARTIRQGVELLLLTKGGGDRALIVMSDGEAFDDEEDLVAAARRAREAGVALVTVGYGTPDGATIPVPVGRGVELKRDENNQVVVTRYNEQLLRTAAEAAGGTFVPASSTDKAARIRQALANLEREQRQSDVGRERTQRYQLFLLPALLLVLLDTWLAERRVRRASVPAMAAASAAVALIVMLAPAVAVAAPDDAERHYNAGRYAEAAAVWQSEIAGGDTSARTFYNLGTALLKAKKADEAIEALERAAHATDEEIRYRALFNLGLLHLERARSAEEEETAAPDFAAANGLYRRALRLRPGELDAKWNYELTLRKPPEGGGGGGGGGGGAGSAEPEEGRAQPEPQPQPRAAGGLDPRQAERLLNSAAREERDVQGRKQQQARAERPPVGKDW